MQRGRTADLIFGPVEIVAYISRILTLEPGDLILTGTRAGWGMGAPHPCTCAPARSSAP
jgi:acylpyruvate hydrolase